MHRTVLSLIAAVCFLVGATGSAADGSPRLVWVFPITGQADHDIDEIALLDELVLTGLRELPQSEYSVESAVSPEEAAGDACDLSCQLTVAFDAGAQLAVVGKLKQLGSGDVLTLTVYDPEDEQVLGSTLTGVSPDLNALMESTRESVAELREKLAALAVPAEEIQPASAEQAPETSGALGILKVTSDPPGAEVHAGGTKRESGEVIGMTPLEKELQPWSFWLHVEKEGYLGYRQIVKLAAGQTVEIDVTLEKNEWPPLRIVGHATLWPGLALGLLGAFSGWYGWKVARQYDEELDPLIKEESRKWVGVMWGAGGAGLALTTTGIICLVSYKKGDEAPVGTDQPGVVLIPAGDGHGGAAALVGRF